MKQVFIFRFGHCPAVLVASLSVKLLELERAHGFKFMPTGFKWDPFGKSYVRNNFEDWQIYDLAKLRKQAAKVESWGQPCVP